MVPGCSTGGHVMEPHHYLLSALGVLGFLTNILVLAITGTRALSKTETTILERITAIKDEIEEEIAVDRRITGEAFAAVRHKIHEVELYMRDKFVLNSRYEAEMQRLLAELANLQQATQDRD